MRQNESKEEYYLDLLHVVSHEIKNTATSIHGYNRLLKRSLLEGKTTKATDTTDQIERLSLVLYGLCDSLYYLSLLDQDKIIQSKKVFDLNRNALEPVIEELEQELRKNNLKLKVDSPGKGVLFLGEDRLFRIAFRNILNNAILFSERGKSISIKFKSCSDRIDITIKNHGPAITTEELDSLFDRYVTVNPRIRKNPGYNLYIVKRIIEIHGGNIKVSRSRAGWMHFTINLPVLD